MKWQDIRSRFNAVVATYFVGKQRKQKKLNDRKKKLNDRTKQDLKRIWSRKKTFMKRLIIRLKENRILGPKWLCLTCGASNLIGGQCPACKKSRSDTTLSGIPMSEINFSYSKLNVSPRKLFTLSTCPKTKVPVVTSIDDVRCPSGLYPGDYLIKVNEINVIKSKKNEKAE